jgi:hypothetical protein
VAEQTTGGNLLQVARRGQPFTFEGLQKLDLSPWGGRLLQEVLIDGTGRQTKAALDAAMEGFRIDLGNHGIPIAWAMVKEGLAGQLPRIFTL